ncbi:MULTISPECIES: metallophosphoesterase [unclassified Aureimonas]|uniref:metallophosphoesterase n=1 Tax=unclassified Aureimonas TaxID=2615206 RepID=UPI0006FD1C26|nr:MULTISPECIES: metallophosphoesterase [unclassified Aureimonas]KQT61191.1 hypothetical protein ASG62_24100 [Aureimonas sp. Leaf427]KQT62960.1 hypothetical protein ASG54_23045 [Aureimonas sp. Leaf460]
MKLWIRSDLHDRTVAAGHPPVWSARAPEYDVAVLAGDIAAPPANVIDQLVREFSKPVVYVAGNHEFYRFGLDVELAEAIDPEAPPNDVHFLENAKVVIDGVRFLGTTLWTDYCLNGVDNQPLAMAHAQAWMNDHRLIWHSDRKFRPGDALAMNRRARRWLADRLAEPFYGKTVVVTHHAPARGSLAERWIGDSVSPAFVSDMSAEIEEWQPDLWIHGHVHDSFDYRIGRTRVVCNPKGYGGENPAYDPRLVIEI